MTGKTFGLIGTGILVGGALLAVLFSFVVSDSSSAEFTPLSDGTMANLVGGAPQKWNGQTEGSGEGSFADCDGKTPPCTPTQQNHESYYPVIYICTTCISGNNEYYVNTIYREIGSWCEQDGPSSCKYMSDGFDQTVDCQYQKGTTC